MPAESSNVEVYKVIDGKEVLIRIEPPTLFIKKDKGGAYRLYLDSKKWKYKRKRIKRRDGWRCHVCGNKEFLHVHHLTYDNLFNERKSDLVTLCKDCHKELHTGIPKDLEYLIH
jgi:hypothetical protein